MKKKEYGKKEQDKTIIGTIINGEIIYILYIHLYFQKMYVILTAISIVL